MGASKTTIWLNRKNGNLVENMSSLCLGSVAHLVSRIVSLPITGARGR